MKSPSETWFITGASSGFGKAFARHALAHGHNVVATARNPSTLHDLTTDAPDRVLAMPLDVTRVGEADAAVAGAMARFGAIDVLINNAGYAVVGAVEETSDAELRAVMDTNFFGAMAVIRAVLPVMRQQRSGAIVNMSSMGGQLASAGFGAYAATKFALEGASEALAREMEPFGVKVLVVEPGPFVTNLAVTGMKYMPAMEEYQPLLGSNRAGRSTAHITGDPMKAVAVVAAALKAEDRPFRLQLGRLAIDLVRDHSEKLLAELAIWETRSAATD